MNTPLEEKISELCSKYTRKELQKAASDLTKRYHLKKAQETELHRLAYLVARMPATCAVLAKVFKEIKLPETILDCGAGPGTSLWALLDAPIKKVTLLERDVEFVKLGKKLIPNVPFEASWLAKSFIHFSEKADLILFSYSLNEIPQESLEKTIRHAIKQTDNMLVVIEPGTPEGFERVRFARSIALEAGLSLHAPCPHHNECPMKGSDWCHFSARLSRSSLHRFLKKGSLGHEDEKYSYLIASKTPHIPSGSRVLRHPLKKKGHTVAMLCTEEGVKQSVFKGKEKKEIHWGSLIS
ncbi:MAG: hypothetical protein H7A38_01530 [Chlamydiales bacterium]|nr:hypothetical protein [Chlamydiales bacterium]